MKPRINVRLKMVAQGDFRRSEYTLFSGLPRKFRKSLNSNDAVCFVSGSGSQVVFVYSFTDVGRTKGNTLYGSRSYGIVTSVRLRLTGSTFNPLMLQNYAGACGIELEGLRHFEDYFYAPESY